MPGKSRKSSHRVETASPRVELTREQMMDLYYYLKLNRMVEERLVNLYRQGKVVGGLYTSLGQEAISIGTSYALGKHDVLAPMIRNLGALLVRGYSPKDILTQYMARKDSPSGGRDCNLHIGDVENKGVVACISMVGALVPVMAGVALAAKMQKKKIVALTYVGDGSTSTTDFHEGINMAAVLKVPLVLIIESNQWSYSTPISKQMNIKDIAVRAKAYGIKGVTVDGNDVLEVYRTTRQCVEEARAGHGPIMIDCKTMRMKGHAEHDDASYVPKEMLEEWRKKDPIDRYENYLVRNEIMSQREKKEVAARIEKELDEAVAFAEASPFPEGHEAAGRVFKDN